MDAHSLKVLELDKVKALLSERIRFEPAKELALTLTPFGRQREAEEELELVHSCSSLLPTHSIPSFALPDPLASLEKAEVGGTLGGRELLETAEFQRGVRVARAFFESVSKEFLALWKAASRLSPTDGIEKRVFAVIEPSFGIADGASRELKRIRSEIRSQRERILSSLRKEAEEDARPGEETGITIRGERYVIPVRGDRSSKGKGIVHDRSQSGLTFFVEPLAVVELNNRLIELRSQEKDEENRILAELSRLVAEAAGPIARNIEIIAHFALIRGKAELAVKWNSRPIKFVSGQKVSVRSFRHPLLLAGKSFEDVVPLDLEMGGEKSILLISGPNAGGKTVALKTIGLLSAMSMCGMPVPAGDGSELPFFGDILADIGDEQSIEDDLSTFSSHLKQLVAIVEKADSSSLILLDEMGLGTDPSEGGAIAMAILEHLASRRSFTIATTHLGELKIFASTVPAIENACMEFDPETEKPRFRMKVGIPGQSRAIATARRLGLRGDIADRACEFLGEEKVRLEEVLDRLDTLSARLSSEKESARKEREEAELLRTSYRERISRADSEARDLRKKAKEESRAILSEARRVLEEARGLLKKKDITHADTERAKQLLETREAEIAEPLFHEEKRVEPVNLAPGTTVRVSGIDWEGVIAGTPDSQGRILVERNGIRFKVPADALEVDKKESHAGGQTRKPVTVKKDEEEAFAGVVDVRGLRTDDALAEVDRALDAALLQGKDEIRIIHGIGRGILKKMISDMLGSHPAAGTVRDGRRDEGGMGVTVVRIK